MSIRIKGPNGNGPADGTPNMEFAYRSLVSSSQQKLFAKVLSQVRSDGGDTGKQEINSLQEEIKGLQRSGLNGQKTDLPTVGESRNTTAAVKPEQGFTGDLTTSALLRLAALHPQRGANLSGYYKEAFGTRRLDKAEAASPHETAEYETAGTRGSDKAREFQGPGSLSARFESGENGVGTIGYDDSGGTSYGIYQISSRAGTMEQFLSYLEEHAPKWAERLKSSGRANTGSTGGAIPREWKKIAAEDPDRFAQLQRDFIEKTHYLPALDEIYRRTGFDAEKQSRAVQEVLWSTAVQHGPRGAANIFCKAIEQGQLTGKNLPESSLIRSVYTSRTGYLGALSRDIRDAVGRRFQEEKSMALAMLADEPSRTEAQA